MKKMIKFLRGVHPFIFLPILFFSTLILFAIFRPVMPEIVLATIFGEVFIFLAAIFLINALTKGEANNNGEQKYEAGVVVSYFNDNIRWSGYFKNKHTAKFAAIYQAWFLDHFGNVHPDCGIKYYVSPVES